MKAERIEELRQLAGAVDSPRSGWMDELLDEVERLRPLADAKNDLRKELSRVDAALLAMTVERDNLKKMLEDERQRPDAMRTLAREILSHVQSGVLVHLPHGRSKQLSVSENVIEGWQRILSPKPVPMCQDPLVDLFPASGEGRPT